MPAVYGLINKRNVIKRMKTVVKLTVCITTVFAAIIMVKAARMRSIDLLLKKELSVLERPQDSAITYKSMKEDPV